MSKLDVQELKDWILKQGLREFTLDDVFVGMCKRMSDEFSLSRVSIGMQTLHPLLEARTIRWNPLTGLESLESEHGFSDHDDWRLSPLSYMFEQSLGELRYRLDQPGSWQRFPLLNELAKANSTEYYATIISFNDNPKPSAEDDTDGMLTSWATNHPEGFSEEFFQAINQILPALGIVSKLADRESALINILDAYLGKDAGRRVLKGQIERGELISIDAVIWYSDMRDSTYLADNLSSQEFLDTLNTYFECTAGSILESNGQVLRFIGDAVLAIFPVETFGTAQLAAESAWQAATMARDKIDQINSTREPANLHLLDFGLGLHAGTLKYGNIGVPTRLEFSVIGPVANEVARLESLTKELEKPVIVSESFSQLLPLDWKCLGSPKLKGVNKDFLVYSVNN